VTKEEIISALKECAARLGHAPSYTEFRGYADVKMHGIRKHFPTYTSALSEAGLERLGGGHTLTMQALLKEWAHVTRKLNKIPTMAEFEVHGKYTARPLVSRFMSWTHVPRSLLRFAEKEGLETEYGDVIALIKADDGRVNERAAARKKERSLTPAMATTTAATNAPAGETAAPAMAPNIAAPMRPILTRDMRTIMRRPIMLDRPVYGAPMLATPLCHVPINEMGVVYLFGAMAWELGFMVTRIQREFPDCEAMREMDLDQWQRVWIEFEWESRNFLEHQHDPEKCDLIVCWRHNWPECPLEVVELSSLVRERANFKFKFEM
jgi:hypothetical protein